MTTTWVHAVETFAKQQQLPLLTFTKHTRKEDVAADYRRHFTGREGLLFIGKAQEKVTTFRTEGRRNPQTGQSYPWLVRTTALVNQYYFYGVDADFGPFFIKFSSYFPFGGRLCVNGHEYVKCQLAQAGVAFEPLANGLHSCADPQQAQAMADRLTAARLEALLHKWLARLPLPFSAADQQAGYRYELSILQAEFAVTQVLDRPVVGRQFFEEVIRDNLDLGRPDNVQLLFGRRVTKRTPGPFRTRVVTEGVLPSLYVDYKTNRLKQYFKEGRALRTELVVNNPWDFRVGRRLVNLAALREQGFAACRRLLDVQRTSRNNALSAQEFAAVTRPCRVGQQRTSGLGYGQELVLGVLHLLLLYRQLPCGFRNHQLREPLARLLGKAPQECTAGQVTYQLRRLRLHGLIAREAGTHSYRVTGRGWRVALFFTRSYARLLRPGLEAVLSDGEPAEPELERAFAHVDRALEACAKRAGL
jgi:hypothetical protein